MKSSIRTTAAIPAILAFFSFLVSAQIFSQANSNFQQPVSINSDGSEPHHSAQFDVNATDRGILVPRMKTSDRISISSPARGLLVFDTDTGSFWFHNGLEWQNLSAQKLLQDGDGDTRIQVEANPDEDIIRLSTAGVERMTILDNGNVGIGSTLPTSTLFVEGTAHFSNTITTDSANISNALTANSVKVSSTLTTDTADVTSTLNASIVNISKTLNTDTANISSILSVNTANISNALTANSVNVSSTLTTDTADVTSTLNANIVNILKTLNTDTANISSALTANTANISSTLAANTANISSALTASTASISSTLTAAGAMLTNGDFVGNALNGVINCGGSINPNGNVIGDVTTPTITVATGDEDLWIQGDLEVVGNGYKTGGGMWATISDQRLKMNIEPFAEGLDQVMEINPVRFQYNEKVPLLNNGKQYIGVLAQDVLKIAPYMVNPILLGQVVQEDENGHEIIIEEGDLYYTYDGSALTYLLVNAVQQQQGSIEQEKLKIEELAVENSVMKAEILNYKNQISDMTSQISKIVGSLQSAGIMPDL